MTYLIILTRTVQWSDTDFRMVASTDFDEAHHMFDKWKADNESGYGTQTGTVVRLVQCQGNELREMRKVDYRG